MWSLFYRNLRLLILTICLIVVWGVSSYQTLPQLEDPEFSQWYGGVLTSFPGVSASRVETLVTEKVEGVLEGIQDLRKIESTSVSGLSSIFLEVEPTVDDVDEVWSQVRDRLSDAVPLLPQGAGDPEYVPLDFRALAAVVALTWEADSPPNSAILRRQSEELSDRLQAINGSDRLVFFGQPSEEVIVEVDPDRAAVLGLTPQRISQQIRGRDAKVAAGQVYGEQNRLVLDLAEPLDSIDRLRQLPLRSHDSRSLHLNDLAAVRQSIREPPAELARVNGKPAVVLGVQIDTSLRVDRWAQEAYRVLDGLRDDQPPELGIEILLDLSQYVEARLQNLVYNLLLGVFFVCLCTGIMMGWKSALIIGSALPLSILMVVGWMGILDISLNQISISGLIIALGLLIDNAIVVVDELTHFLKSGYSSAAAIDKTVKTLATPLLASTLTTVIAFVPILLLPGDKGEFVRPLAQGVILALLSSLGLSLTVVLAIAGRFYRSGNAVATGISWSPLTRVYRGALSFCLSRPLLGMVLAFGLPILGFRVAGQLPEQFFPATERNQFLVEYELPPSASMAETQTVVSQAESLLEDNPRVTDVYSFFGVRSPAFYQNMPPKFANEGPNYASSFVILDDSREVPQLVEAVQRELDRNLPSARAIARQLVFGPYIPAPIELRVYGDDLATLQRLGNQLRSLLAGVPGIVHTRVDLGETLPGLALRWDDDALQRAGLSSVEMAEQLQASLDGIVGGSILAGSDELPVRVRWSNADRGNVERIAALTLQGTNASPPLSAVSSWTLVPQLTAISRREGVRVNTIQGFVRAGVLPAVVLAEFRQRVEAEGFSVPPGYRLEIGGESAERDRAVEELMSAVGVLLVMMVATLVLSLNSFRSAGIIAIVGVGSVGLGMLSLWLFGYPFGFMAMLGTVGLVGVAINDSIVVLAGIQDDAKAAVGDRGAIREVVVRSTRHVLTTTFTTMASFVPLILGGGGFWPPMAICIAGGVGGATLLALFFVPCAYVLVKRPRVS
ncbi:efflux RND transporter permease subunit [Baaleninema simplex]|uniref:efflux RND transporter permease subunit n=1 Tax=Baaleninema simplex TaxID=2862350 RepID=UPI000346F60D|nr:efflux RND transporter permease subunit [Baaleninema simplex]